MSEWRRIWAESIKANSELALNRSKGELAFKRLFEAHPNDGMIYYERAEAYEYLKEFDLSDSDYAAAEKLLLAPHWKAIACEGHNRIQQKRQPSANLSEVDKSTKSSLLHRIHAIPKIPHKVRVEAIFAIARLDSEPEMVAGQLRACLEELAVILLDDAYLDHSDTRNLQQLLSLFSKAFAIPSQISEKMEVVRDLGNKGLHKEFGRRRNINFSQSASEFVDILEWIGSHK